MALRRPAQTVARTEIRSWYIGHLRPKLVRAVREQLIRPSQAADLERLMRTLLPPEDGLRPAAFPRVALSGPEPALRIGG